MSKDNDDDTAYVPSDSSTSWSDSSDCECWSLIDDNERLNEEEKPSYLLIECAADTVNPTLR